MAAFTSTLFSSKRTTSTTADAVPRSMAQVSFATAQGHPAAPAPLGAFLVLGLSCRAVLLDPSRRERYPVAS